MPDAAAGGAPARHVAALLRIALAAAIVVALHAVGEFPIGWQIGLGVAAALLLFAQAVSPPWFARLPREDRLALWIALVVLALIGYMHNLNTWSADGKGLLRPAQVGLWKTELVLGIALAVPLLSTLRRLLRPTAGQVAGREFTKEFALYVNFSGIALALWDREALLTREVGAMLLAWIALAELTLYASD
jgi:hypothetical protein